MSITVTNTARHFAHRFVPKRVLNGAKRLLGIPATRLHPDWSILASAGPVLEPHIVVDVGAHHGWFFHCWKDWCPSAEIHAFEPDAESLQRCADLWGDDATIHLNGVALSSREGREDFHILEGSRVSSSLLAPDTKRWQEIQFETGEISTVDVAVTTLDRYLAENRLDEVHLLKIDVQGAELEVLKGSEGSLPRIGFILVESAIQPLYRGAPRFTRVADLLLDREFHLVDLRAWHQGDGKLIETDMLFRNDRLSQLGDPTLRAYSSVRKPSR